MGRMTVLDPGIFPIGLRSLVTIPSEAGSETWKDELSKRSLGELKMAMKILMEEYPGAQMVRKQRIKAEIHRRERAIDRGGFEGAQLPRARNWSEDFKKIWTETCAPFRRLSGQKEGDNPSNRNNSRKVFGL